MPSLKRRVHVIPISRHLDRLAEPLKKYRADRVYIISNKNPVDTHKEINDELLDEVRILVKNHTQCYETDEVIEEEIDFYRFSNAVSGLYKILYKEKLNENEVIINISGGTRPVAIASSYTCSFSGIGEPIYYVAEKYKLDSQIGSSKGVLESPFSVSPLNTGALDLSDKIPESEEKIDIILGLEAFGGESQMKKILVNAGKITDVPSENTDRQKIIQRYHSHANKLVEMKVIEKEDGMYSLTSTGELFAEMIKVQREVKESRDR